MPDTDLFQTGALIASDKRDHHALLLLLEKDLPKSALLVRLDYRVIGQSRRAAEDAINWAESIADSNGFHDLIVLAEVTTFCGHPLARIRGSSILLDFFRTFYVVSAAGSKLHKIDAYDSRLNEEMAVVRSEDGVPLKLIPLKSSRAAA